MIVITLYNENEVLFCRTMHGVMKNVAQLCKRQKSQTWGEEGWKKVVVTIVADGRKAIHPRVLDCLSALGIYQEGLATNQIDSEPVTAHCFEYTTQFSLSSDLKIKVGRRSCRRSGVHLADARIVHSRWRRVSYPFSASSCSRRRTPRSSVSPHLLIIELG